MIKSVTEIKGKQLTLKQISEKYNVNISTIRYRYKNGYRGNKLIAERLKGGATKKKINLYGNQYTYEEISKKYNININTLIKRYSKGLRGKDLIESVKNQNIQSSSLTTTSITINNYSYTLKEAIDILGLDSELIESKLKKGIRDIELLKQES